MGWDGHGSPEEQAVLTILEDIGQAIPTLCLSFLAYETRRIFPVNSSESCSTVWLHHVFVSFEKKNHYFNMWAHGMNPSLILLLSLVPKKAVFEDEYFGRKCMSGSPFHYSCQEAQIKFVSSHQWQCPRPEPLSCLLLLLLCLNDSRSFSLLNALFYSELILGSCCVFVQLEYSIRSHLFLLLLSLSPLLMLLG